uniref:Uncharacterized protein n=1 Tax=Strigamia maritima TaxID=126957 RepID=T1J295_STRMM
MVAGGPAGPCARLQIKRNGRTPAILNRKRKHDFNEELEFDISAATESTEKMTVDDNIFSPENTTTMKTTWSRFRALTTLPMLPVTKSSPLPNLTWADSHEVWDLMIKKDMKYKRDSNVLRQHPSIEAGMRSILLDWLIEVCEVYRLHRDTYYLCLDFIDRFLATQFNLPKSQLQLVGITALFLAAKIEEIYPPKLSEFAYVTDGACTENEILEKELIILRALNWDLSPVTVQGWINTFLQISNLKNIKDVSTNFVIPQYSGYTIVQISQLVDLCMLDIGNLSFAYSIIAASALYHVTSKDLTFRVSGYKWADIHECVQWMSPFAATTREHGPAQPKYFEQISDYDMHNIQTHTADLTIHLQDAQARLSCVYTKDNPDFMTPHKSYDKNCLDVTDDEDDDIF